MSDNTVNRTRFYGLVSMFNNWIFSVGAVALLLFLGQYVSKLLFPGLVLILQFLLMRRSHRTPTFDEECNLLPHVMSRILFFSAIVMVAINFYYLKIIDPQQFTDGRANKDIPYIAILIVAPVSTVIVGWTVAMRGNLFFCRSCRMFQDGSTGHGLFGRLLTKEYQYQLRMLLVVSVIATIYAWTYYAIHYSNANLSHSDRFYYNWIPIILYLLSVVYMAMRYWSIFAFFEKNTFTEDLPSEFATLLRYIILCDDKVLLTEHEVDGSSLLDTPVTSMIHSTTKMDVSVARREFERLCGRSFDNAEFRILYETQRHQGYGNVFHVLAVIPSRRVLEETPYTSGVWLTAYQISTAFKDGRVRTILGAEIHRIYTVAMAYKAYDRSGLRRYSVRHYKPLFNLDELLGLDVDFNDPAWLLVARDNEDRPFFHLRRFWRKYVGGFEM